MKKTNKVSLISSIAFFIIGLFIFLYPDSIIKFASYCFGGVLILIGLYRTFNYVIQDKKLGVVNKNEIAFGITAIVLGVVFIFLADAIELLLRFIVGGWIIITGISKIFQTFYMRNRDAKFYSLIVVGLILVAIGLYIVIVSNLAISIIGLFMVLYAIIDFISYFVYRDKEEVKQSSVISHDEDVIDAEVVEKKED